MKRLAIMLLVLQVVSHVGWSQTGEENEGDTTIQQGSTVEDAVDREKGRNDETTLETSPDVTLEGEWTLKTEGALITNGAYEGYENIGHVETFVEDFRNPEVIREGYIRESDLFSSLEFVDDSIMRVTRESGESFTCIYRVVTSTLEFTFEDRFHLLCKTTEDVDYLLTFRPHGEGERFTLNYVLTGEPQGEHYSSVTWQAQAVRDRPKANDEGDSE